MAFTIIEGEIVRIFDTSIVNSFEKREFWVREIAEYASTWPVSAVHGAGVVLDGYKVGDKVQVVTQVKGVHYTKNGNDSCFLNLQMIRIMPWQDVQKKGASQPAQATPSSSATNVPPPPEPKEPEGEDLPF